MPTSSSLVAKVGIIKALGFKNSNAFYLSELHNLQHGLVHLHLHWNYVYFFITVGMEILIKAWSRCHKDHHKSFPVIIVRIKTRRQQRYLQLPLAVTSLDRIFLTHRALGDLNDIYIGNLKSNLAIDGWDISCEISHREMPWRRIILSMFIQIIVWCLMVPSHSRNPMLTYALSFPTINKIARYQSI